MAILSFHFFYLLLYYIILSFFTIYSFHRFFIIFLYWKYYKKSSHKVIQLTKGDPNLPFVTVQVPIYNEFYVAERIIETVTKLAYPNDKLEIQILDDSTDETSNIIRKTIAKLQKRNSPQVFHLRRKSRIDFKAGALKEGLKRAKGEIIAIFDADFLPDKDFLLKTVGYFHDQQVCVVQTRWTYLNAKNSVITRSQYMTLDAHFQLEHTARYASGRFLNFNGTAGLLRKSAMLAVGNWQGDTLTEDLDISYRIQLKGYRVVYLPHVECLSELPEDIVSLKNQQARWAQGSIQVARKLFIPILKAPFPLTVKLEALMHLCAPIAYICSLLLSVFMPLVSSTLMHSERFHFLQPELALSFLIIISLGTYYLYAQKELQRPLITSLKHLLPVFSIGTVFCINNSWAIIKAFVNRKSEFLRTPKYSNYKKKLARESGLKYRPKVGWVIMSIEVLCALWLNVSVYSVIVNGNWFVLPLLLILVLGFNYNLYLNFFYR